MTNDHDDQMSPSDSERQPKLARPAIPQDHLTDDVDRGGDETGRRAGAQKLSNAYDENVVNPPRTPTSRNARGAGASGTR